jgi:hypothetical protein
VRCRSRPRSAAGPSASEGPLADPAQVGSPPPDAEEPCRTELGEVPGVVRGLVGVAVVVEVELDVADVRIGLVEHAGVDELAQHVCAGKVRRVVDHRVGGRMPGQVHRIPGRGLGDPRVLGQALVVHRQRSSAGPAGEDDLLVTPDLARVPHVGTEVERDVLHDQRGVVARIAATRAQHVRTCRGHRPGYGQELERRRRVHVDEQAPGLPAGPAEADTLQVDERALAARVAVDLADVSRLGVLDVNPLRYDLVRRRHAGFRGMGASNIDSMSAMSGVTSRTYCCQAGSALIDGRSPSRSARSW